ncbi:alpha/beta fold hydrolase [Actinomadura algeriensis]|uniref:Pimeloyl-ACP methyl ester carboxylesterase n=1 Tax=Actinomadura algeriensis TaxID=1679523 RepID=A0ABR9JQK3_9ACTN|nr:alpha/beta hydrolase [Actinomadura algeriensis]MBE1532768.1 pimeloyl-ACP methyl ester carboxylesterase [Actinomadura algeriensis]
MVSEHARTRDGRELHLERHGTGRPVVVFESGAGASRNMWGTVVPAISGRATAVVYDRSGLGRSPADPAPRTLARLVADLHDLLDHLGDGPFILVGHDWGGPIVRCVAAERPERVTGLLLVDQDDEASDHYFMPGTRRRMRLSALTDPAAARLGLFRFNLGRLAGKLPEPAATALREEDGTLEATRVQMAEMSTFIDDLQRLRDDPPKLPDVPVTLISGRRSGSFGGGGRASLNTAHRARAETLPRGRHIVAEKSGYLVPFTEPGLLVREILRIMDVTR